MCNFSEAAATNVKATAAGAEVASNCSHLPHTLRKVPTHSVVKQEIHSHRKNILWNQLCNNFFGKNVAFTNFFSKKCESDFRNFHTVVVPLLFVHLAFLQRITSTY